MLVSFNCVYEIGYYENDMHAAKNEVAPVLSPQTERFRAYPIGAAWGWGPAIGAFGLSVAVVLFHLPTSVCVAMIATWLVVLLVTRITFYAYNRLPSERRVFVYPCLQVLKYGAIFPVLGANMFGTLLVASQITTMWVTYLVYRFDGDQKKLPREQLRAAAFTVGLLLLFAARWTWNRTNSQASFVDVDWLTLALIIAWLAARIAKASAMKQIKKGVASA
jgi:hypothetical protein